MQSHPWIFIISTPRSGTTQVSTLLSSFLAVRNFSEPFNPRRPSYFDDETLAQFSDSVGVQFETHHDPKLKEWIDQHPAQTLALLLELSKPSHRGASAKVFDGHLTRAQFEKYVAQLPDSHFLFIQRSPIDSYISFMKARAQDKWLSVDTTQKSVQIDVDEFVAWHAQQAIWFRDARDIVARWNRPSADLVYEDHLLCQDRVATNHIRSALKDMGIAIPTPILRQLSIGAKQAINAGFGALGRKPMFNELISLKKQDLSPSRAAKVENWEEFLSGVEAITRGHEMLDRYFVHDELEAKEASQGAGQRRSIGDSG